MSDLASLSTRHSALADELADKTQELADATRILEEARAQAKRAVLDNIYVATPCSMDWNAMTGDERVRACDACDKNVFNISGLTREEAEALIREKNGDLCVRYYQRNDGTILLQDCSVGVSQKRKTRVLAVGALLLLGGSALFAWKVNRKGAPKVRVEETYELLGKVTPPAPAPHVVHDTGFAPPPRPLTPPHVDPVKQVTPSPVHETRGKVAVPPKEPVHKMMGAMVLRKTPPSPTTTGDVE
ncbi:MAG TPA: hypothetical protein VGM90_32635 [Kofleriaceae bacterium]